jgi:hypothetical protein
MMDVCEKIVRYGRTKIIGNEEQFLATVLSCVSCFSPDDRQFISTILVGESAGGKTHVQLTAFDLIDPKCVKVLSGGSEKAPIYSEELRDKNTQIKIIRLSELQKLPPSILEYMKGLSGDDGEFTYEYTESAKGRTKTIKQQKRPYSVTYAQVDIDKELKTRVFIIPVAENVDINRCVAALKFGAPEVEYRGRKYGEATDEDDVLKRELMDIIASLELMPMEVSIKFPFALIDMVNHSRPESKRHAQMISSLIASSCRLNFSERKIEGGKLVASAQDVVNVMSMFNLLQSTVMGIDMIDSIMYKYIAKTPRCTSSNIIGHLTNLGFGELTRTEMKRRLDKLHDENYIETENTVDGIKYFTNSSKQILSLKVDWKNIYEHDNSSVTDPLTSVVYDDICDYGKMICEVHRIVEPDGNIDVIDDPTGELSREETLRCAVIDVLEEEGRISAGLIAVKATRMVPGSTKFDFMELVFKMKDEHLIGYDEKTETFMPIGT